METQKGLENIASRQRDFIFNRGPKELGYRVQQLKTLKKAIEEHEQQILDALKRDLNKPVAESGMGAYHGKASFETFSHKRSVFKRSFLADPGMKYPPYKPPLKYLKKVLKILYR
jgi:hypothetical protein